MICGSWSRDEVGSVGGVADVDFRRDSCCFGVAFAEIVGKLRSLLLVDEVDGASSEAAAGEAGADESGQILSEIDHGVGFDAAGFEVLAIADVSFVHEAAEGFEVAGIEGSCGGDGADIFGDNVAGALEGSGWDFVAPFIEIVDGSVAQEFDFRAMGGQDAAGFFDGGTTAGVTGAGDGVLDHGVGDDQGYVFGDGGELVAEVAAVEEQSVIGFAIGGDELVHDAAIGADELVF
jgi:hypothetical protein